MGKFNPKLFEKIKEFGVAYIYVVRVDNTFKVGMSSLPEQRINLISTDNSKPTETLAIAKIPLALEYEQIIHQCLRKGGYHIRGEWYRYDENAINWLLNEIKDITNGLRPEILELLK